MNRRALWGIDVESITGSHLVLFAWLTPAEIRPLDDRLTALNEDRRIAGFRAYTADETRDMRPSVGPARALAAINRLGSSASDPFRSSKGVDT